MNEAEEIRKEISKLQSKVDNQTFTIKELLFERRTNIALIKLLNKKLNGATVNLREVCLLFKENEICVRFDINKTCNYCPHVAPE